MHSFNLSLFILSQQTRMSHCAEYSNYSNRNEVVSVFTLNVRSFTVRGAQRPRSQIHCVDTCMVMRNSSISFQNRFIDLSCISRGNTQSIGTCVRDVSSIPIDSQRRNRSENAFSISAILSMYHSLAHVLTNTRTRSRCPRTKLTKC